jgi:hypothetical protein
LKKKRDKKDKSDKNNNLEHLDDDYKPESEKLVEQKMADIQARIESLDSKKEIDAKSIPKDLADLEKELEKERLEARTKGIKTSITGKNKYVTAKFKPELKNILPVWVDKPFYYITPNEKLSERRKLWQKEWADFFLQWANAKDKYIVEILLLQQEYPFKNPVINKQLKKDQLELIGDYLVEQGIGEWRNKKKTHLRVYWESLEETAETIFQWAFERGNRYLGIFDVLDSGQPFSELTQEEIYKCLIILVRVKKAEWADKKREMIYLLFPT